MINNHIIGGGVKMMKIKELRNKAGLSQVALAEKLNVTQSVVSLWESGATFPSSAKLPRLAEILGCTVSDLFSGEDGKE